MGGFLVLWLLGATPVSAPVIDYQHTLYTSTEGMAAETVTLGGATDAVLSGGDNVTLSNGGGLG